MKLVILLLCMVQYVYGACLVNPDQNGHLSADALRTQVLSGGQTVIPTGSISDTTMSCCSTLKSVEIPSEVTEINYLAFGSNGKQTCYLESITFEAGSNLRTIGASAFYNSADSLTIPPTISVTIPDSVQTIGYNAFSYTRLNSVTIGNNVKTIGTWAFANNQISGDFIIPNSVETIGNSAFKNNQLTSVTIGNSVRTITDFAFYNNQLTSVTIGNNVKTIGNYAFKNNQISGNLIIPNSVETIGNSAFYKNQLNSVTIGNSVETIGDYAFEGNQISGNLIIPNNVKTIGNLAFYKNQLNSVTIGNSVETIGDYAFWLNQISGNLIIPNSVLTIGDYAFKFNTNINDVFVHGNPTIGTDAFYYWDGTQDRHHNIILNFVNGNRLKDSMAWTWEDVPFSPSAMNATWSNMDCESSGQMYQRGPGNCTDGLICWEDGDVLECPSGAARLNETHCSSEKKVVHDALKSHCPL